MTGSNVISFVFIHVFWIMDPFVFGGKEWKGLFSQRQSLFSFLVHQTRTAGYSKKTHLHTKAICSCICLFIFCAWFCSLLRLVTEIYLNSPNGQTHAHVWYSNQYKVMLKVARGASMDSDGNGRTYPTALEMVGCNSWCFLPHLTWCK